MITIKSAQVYSTHNEMAYLIEYTDGTQVRAVEAKDKIIRCEYLKNGLWVTTSKPYVITSSKVRNAEKIKNSAIDFCNN
jgi:hypothetical protein